MLIIYKASAGSGKTYTLAKTYISLLLWRPTVNDPEKLEINLDNDHQKHEANRHRSILAITFTRKATEEMKHRIMDELSRLSKLTPDTVQKVAYAQDFIREYGCTPQQLAAASSLALQELLFDYQNFNVSTIDAFFQRVLQAFARELDMQADYKVELNDEMAMQNAVGVMLDQFNTSAEGSTALEGWLYTMLRNQMDEGKKANFFNRKSKLFSKLVDLISQIKKETFKEFSDDMKRYLEGDDLDKFDNAIDTFIKNAPLPIKETAQAAIASHGIDLDGMKHSSKIYKLCMSFLDGNLPEAADWNNENVNALMNNGTPDLFKKGKGSIDQFDALRDMFGEIRKISGICNDLKIIKGSLTQLGLLKHAWSILEKINKENNTLLISDTNMLVTKIIAEDDTPFVYEKMGVKLKHFLIDEFQDTSRMQWQNLRPLVANGQGFGGKSLIIGDEKQSIYRFRNSDSSILHSQVFTDFIDPATGKSKIKLEVKGQIPSENTNHRSSDTIVRFNNTFFATLSALEGIEGYENVKQRVKDEYKNYKGFVSIRFNAQSQQETPAQDDDSMSIADRETSDSKSERIFHEMAREILRQHVDGGYPWKDIAILLNTNSEAADVVNFLARNYPQISVMSDEALKISFSPAVQLIVSLLSLIDQEESDPVPNSSEPSKYLSRRQVQGIINRFELHYSQGMKKFGLELPDEETRRQLADNALQQALNDSNNSNIELYQHINAIRAAKPTTLVALVETILEMQFSAAERNQQLAYIMAFQDVVINFCEEYDGALHSFLDWWKNNSDKQHVQGAAEADAVRVMTLHSSKGLEFHCVHIPLCGWPMLWNPRRAPSLWIRYPEALKDCVDAVSPPAIYLTVTKELLNPDSQFFAMAEEEKNKSLVDTINKTYVAFTRARSELMIWCPPREKKAHAIDQEMLRLFSEYNHKPVPEDDFTMDLSEYWHPEQNFFQAGKPTLYSESDPEKAAMAQDTLITDDKPQDLYPVHYRTDAAALLKLDDLLDLDTDIDDDTTAAQAAYAPDEDDYTDDDEEIRKEGLLMHEMMSHIITKDDVESSIKMVSGRHRLKPELIDKCRNIVSGVVHSAVAEQMNWFGTEYDVLVEQPIYIPSEGYTRRPDRIMLDPQGGATVIDYKFVNRAGRYKAVEHIQQLQEYMGLMHDMGYFPVHGYLCYPRLKKIAKVSMK